MRRVKNFTSWLLVFILSFQPYLYAFPNAAAAGPAGDGLDSQPEVTAVYDSRPQVVAQAGEAANVDFSTSLTDGVGFKFSLIDGAFVDFRLKDAPPVWPIKLGKITVFSLPGQGSVKYTTTERQVKEEIILNGRPTADEIIFKYKSNALDAEKTPEGGYRLLGPDGEPVFEITAPTLVDANGKSGEISLDIAGDQAALKIDPKFLDNAAYPVTIDPTVVVTTTGGVGLSSQRNTFFDSTNNRYWVLYSDAANARARYSANGGSTWTLAAGSITGVTSGSYLSSWFRPTDGVIYVAYRKSYSIYARRGVVSATNIAWDNKEYLVLSGTSANYYTYPAVSQATGGKIIVAAKYLSGSNNSIVGRRTSNANSVTAWEASNFTVSATSTSPYLVPQILQTPDGNNYFTWLHGTAVKGRKYDQTTGLGTETTITSTYSADLAHIPSAVTSGTTIYLGLADANQDLKYRTLASPYTGSWSATSTLSADKGDNVVLALDTSTTGGIYAFYGAPPGAAQRIKQVKLGDPNTTLNLNDPPAASDQVVAPASTSANSFAVWRQGTTVYFSKTAVAPSTSLAINPSAPNGTNGWYKTVPTITLAGSPTSTTTWYSWNSGNLSQYAAPLTNAPAGTDTLSYYSTDTVANQEATKTFSVKVDTTTPTTTADVTGAVDHDDWYFPDVAVNLQANDTVSGVSDTKYRLNAGAWASYTSTITVSAAGTNTLEYYSQDSAGNSEPINQRQIKITNTGTQVGGTISQNTTWTLANSPYIVTTNTVVNSGVRLAIEPGVVVKFYDRANLTINGALFADGTTADRIVFTSIKDDSFAGDTNRDATATTAAKADWGQIAFASTAATSTLNNSVVKYGGYLTSGKYGVISALLPTLTLTNNEISTNNSYAVYAGTNTKLTKSGNTATDNSRNAVFVQSGTTTRDTHWQGTDMPFLVSSFTIGLNKLHLVDPGAVVKFESGNINVNGALSASGTTAQPTVFTSFKDDEFGGDTNNDGTATVPAKGNWSYIGFGDQSIDASSVISNAVVRYGGGIYGNVYLYHASPSITNAAINKSANAGLYLYGNSQPVLSGNTISDNVNGIYAYQTSGTMTISGNTLKDSTGSAVSSGIYLYDSSMAVISDNTITANKYGVYADLTAQASLANNRIKANRAYPVVMADNASVTVNSNDATGNVNDAILLTGTRNVGTVLNKKALVYALDNYTIASSTTVGIEPGAIFKALGSSVNMTVNGTILAQGDENNKITFTSMRDDSEGGDTNNDGSTTVPVKGDWSYLRLNNQSIDTSSVINNAIVRYGGSAYGSVYLYNTSPSITNTVIEKSANAGLYLDGDSHPSLSSNTFSDNQNGIYAYKTSGTLTISGNTLKDSTGSATSSGIYLLDSSSAVVSDNTITANAYGVYASGATSATVNSNNLLNNKEYPLVMAGNSMLRASANQTLGSKYNAILLAGVRSTSSTIPKQETVYGIDVYAVNNATVSIEPGTIFKFEDEKSSGFFFSRFTISGTLLAEGSSSNKIVFTSIRDDSKGGDTNNNGNETTPAPGLWYNLGLSGNASSCRLNNVEVYYGGEGSGGYYAYGALSFSGSSPQILNSKFENNKYSGIQVFGTGSSPTISNSTFVKNGNGISFTNGAGGTVRDSYFGENRNDGIYALDSNPNITKNAFVENTGNGIDNLSDPGWVVPFIRNNDFFGNLKDVDNWSRAEIIDARFNYGGDLGGPIRVSSLVTAVPWARGPYTTKGKELEKAYAKRRAMWYGGDPVNAATGNFYHEDEDLSLPGKGLPVAFKRTYNSQDTANNGPLGRGWTHNYNASLRFEEGGITVIHPDGRRVAYTDDGGGNYVADTDIVENLVKSSDSTYTLTLPDQTNYLFDDGGWLTRQGDKYGNAIDLSYTTATVTSYVNGQPVSGTGRLLTQVAAVDGRALTLSYDPNNRFIKKVTDSASRSVSYSYDSTPSIMKNFTDARGKTTNYTYDTDYQLIGIKEPGAPKEIWRNFYEDGRVAEQLDAFDATYAFNYDPANQETTVTDRRGNFSVIDYNSRYWMTKATDPLGKFAEYVYGDIDQPERVIDANGWSSWFTYDGAGNNTEKTDQQGHQTLASYDTTNNNIRWSEDALGRRTTFNYDVTGKFLQTMTDPIGSTNYDVYSSGLVKTVTDGENHPTDFRYNIAGNLTKVIDSVSDSITMDYDLAGRMTSVTDGEGNRSQFAYDGAGNVTAIKDPMALSDPGNRHQVDFTYDDRGNQSSFTDANNNRTDFGYDLMNNLTSVVDARDATTTYGYDANYNLASVLDAERRSTAYEYDGNDRLTGVTDALAKRTGYGYDGAGNLTETVYPNGNETYYQYFKDNLLKKISYKNEPTTFDFTYNPTHTIKNVVGNFGRRWDFSYDQRDRLTGASENVNSLVGTFTVSRAYDKADNLREIGAGADTTTFLGYNARNDLTSIDLSGGTGVEVFFGYDKARRKRSVSTPGTAATYVFDDAGRVSTVANDTLSGNQSFGYAHDSNGNIVEVTGDGAAGYRYDELNRLTDWYSPLADTTTGYSYDKVGNLTTVKENGVTTRTLSYNAANQISSAGYAYDDNGNMVEAPDKYFVYDSENRLKQVISKSTSATITSYAYDFMGERTSSTDASGSTTFFHYDGWNVVAESNQDGSITANYYYDTNGQISAMKRNGQTYYYQFNAHGDVVSLTDSSGSVINTYSYDPWGNHLSATETVENPYRYAGYRWDGDTGLYYLRARYYGPGIMRFLSQDLVAPALGSPITQNSYQYANDNPIVFIDPSGEAAVLVVGFVFLTVVVVTALLVAPTPTVSDDDAYRAQRAIEGAVANAGAAAVSTVQNYLYASRKKKAYPKKRTGEAIPGSETIHADHPHGPWQPHKHWVERHTDPKTGRSSLRKRSGPLDD